MVTVRNILVLILFCLGSQIGTANNDTIDAKQVLIQFSDSMKTINNAYYLVANTERVDGEYLSGKQYITYQKYPFRSKVDMVTPNTGSQLVFDYSSEYATYSPSGFPYFDMDLNPLGTLMRRNNHHTVHEIGFDYLIEVINSVLLSNKFDYNIIESTDSIISIGVTSAKFGFIDYTVKANEDIRSISQRLKLNEYLILSNNEGVDFYDDISEGDLIKTPNSYAKQVTFTISRNEYYLKDIFVYDNLGLFEEYHYSIQSVNTVGLNFDLDN
jgi:hypothetical protein